MPEVELDGLEEGDLDQYNSEIEEEIRKAQEEDEDDNFTVSESDMDEEDEGEDL